MAIELSPEIQFNLDITNNMRATTNLQAQIKNIVLAILLDHYPLSPEFGINLPLQLRKNRPSQYRNLEKQAETLMTRDPRIKGAKVSISLNTSSGLVSVRANVVPVESTEVINITLNDLLRVT